jgi:hypothetical protein
MDNDDTLTEGFPALERIGVTVSDPKFLVYFNRPGSPTYAAEELPKGGNELFHYLAMRETGCTASEAAIKCIKSHETIVVEKVGTVLQYEYTYLVIH